MEVIYRAEDGREFYVESECVAYEQLKSEICIDALKAANKLKDFCGEYVNYSGICVGCLFADGDRCSIIGAPHIWDIPDTEMK